MNAACISILLSVFTFMDSTCADIYANTNGSETQFYAQCCGANLGLKCPDGLEGILMLADPIDGCSSISKRPSTEENTTINAFVLIKADGDCDLRLKIYHAQKANYDAAIIYSTNSEVITFLKPFTCERYLQTGIVIPSIYVGSSTGSILRQEYLYSSKFKPMLQIFPNRFEEYFLYIVIAAFALFTLALYSFIHCYVHCKRCKRNPTQKRLQRFPVLRHSKVKEYECCAICLEDYNNKEKLRILPCHHAFHRNCIDKWFTSNHGNCPMCKKVFLKMNVKRQMQKKEMVTF